MCPSEEDSHHIPFVKCYSLLRVYTLNNIINTINIFTKHKNIFNKALNYVILCVIISAQ